MDWCFAVINYKSIKTGVIVSTENSSKIIIWYTIRACCLHKTQHWYLLNKIVNLQKTNTFILFYAKTNMIASQLEIQSETERLMTVVLIKRDKIVHTCRIHDYDTSYVLYVMQCLVEKRRGNGCLLYLLSQT